MDAGQRYLASISKVYYSYDTQHDEFETPRHFQEHAIVCHNLLVSFGVTWAALDWAVLPIRRLQSRAGPGKHIPVPLLNLDFLILTTEIDTSLSE